MNILKSVARAISDFDLIQKGDRILIGASGGKDSLVLSYILSQLKHWPSYTCSLTAVQVVAHGTNENPALQKLYQMMDIPFVVLHEPLRLEKHQHLTCYTCATHRRVVLMNYARKHNYNKIALGHHLDDALTTLFMNLILQGRIDILEAKRHYVPFHVTLIRPLIYTPEESIVRFINAHGWNTVTCSCTKGNQGIRAEFRKKVEFLTGGELSAKLRLFSAFLKRK